MCVCVSGLLRMFPRRKTVSWPLLACAISVLFLLVDKLEKLFVQPGLSPFYSFTSPQSRAELKTELGRPRVLVETVFGMSFSSHFFFLASSSIFASCGSAGGF